MPESIQIKKNIKRFLLQIRAFRKCFNLGDLKKIVTEVSKNKKLRKGTPYLFGLTKNNVAYL